MQHPKSVFPDIKPYIQISYEAIYPNFIWHVDIHYAKKCRSNPVFGIIDDYSRKIIACEAINDCCAETTLDVLKRAIDEYGEPYAIWSDNGSENKGVFHAFLEENSIRHIHTMPYTPQQNGKIERFWSTFEKLLSYGLSIDEIGPDYNNSTHNALPTTIEDIGHKAIRHLRRHMTPNEAYDQGDKWDGTQPLRWILDDEEIDFTI